MDHKCANCGTDLFLGEDQCPSCRARVPVAPGSGGPTPGPAGGRAIQASPPPEGLSLIVQKGMADQEARRPPQDSYNTSVPTSFEDAAISFGSNLLNDGALSPTRNPDGSYAWDPKMALLGGIIVAVFVGLAVAYFMGAFNGILKPSL